SAEGKNISTFHLEAGIALIHCTAASFAETDWRAILKLYDAPMRMRPSAIYRLKRAIVLAHLESPEAGVQEIESLASHPSRRPYHLVDAALGELYRRAGDKARSREHLERARAMTQSACDRELLDRKIAACLLDPLAGL